MSLEAARELSIPELLRVLDEKLGIEYSRARKISPSLPVSAATREPEVRAYYLNVTVESDCEPLARESRSPSARYPEVLAFSPEHLFASEQAASRDHFLHRSVRL